MSGRLVRLVAAGAVLVAGLVMQRPVGAQTVQPSTSCSSAVTPSSAAFSQLVAADNGFGFRLLRSLTGGGNTFISPVSISLALDMTYDGAGGQTAGAMAGTLGLQHLSPAATRRQAASLLSRLHSSGAGLSVANSLWARQGSRFRSAFLQDARRDYGAGVHVLDFRSAQAPATINRWVSCATQGKIRTIVDRIPPSVILYLINAVYFHGDWLHPFNLARTHPGSFHLTNGTTQVPMMSQISAFPYYQGANFEAIRLPYKSARFSMVIVEPRGISLQRFTRQVNATTWQRWTAHLKPMQGSLSFPRFSLTTDSVLNHTLASLGMADAFSDHADFSGMCVQPCRISEVRHKSYLAVNERGTVAAAATSVSIEPVAVPQQQFHLVVDHPFLVAIQDSETGAVLFAGAIQKP